MASAIQALLKKIFGDKAEKELKAVMPVVNEINKVFETLKTLDNDALRARSQALKDQIAQRIAPKEAEVKELRDQVEANPAMELDEKERIYDRIDALVQEIDQIIEVVLDEVLPEAFAIVKETARRLKQGPLEVTATEYDRNLAQRYEHITLSGEKAIWNNSWLAAGTPITWDMVHYDVQLIGGYALHKGKVAEMQTGEGKTLVSTLPVFLNALAGKGVHVVTVNDYLARRDAEWMGPLHMFHGLTVDCIDRHQPNSDARKRAYKSDITYGTNNEFGFDYLRDNMASEPDSLVQRKHHFAIVDEVDSVLIDDARTPLIISGPTPRGDQQEFDGLKPKIEQLFNVQKNLVNTLLSEAKRLLANHESASANKEDVKNGSLALYRAHRALPKNKALIKFLSEPGIRQLMQKTENFYIAEQNKNMHIVDAELFFVIDEKNNNVELTEKGVEYLSGKEDPSFFILPDVGASIAEIEKSNASDAEKLAAKDTLLRDYGQKSERIHTINQLLKAYTLFERDVDYVVMEGKVMIVDEQTGRILDGRRYSDGLHQAIESKENVKVEAATQTYATITLQNYFRMYHKLAGMTGTAITEATEFWDIYKLDVMVIPPNKPVQRVDNEDIVYKTKREKYNGIIEEVIKLREAGRPVLVGTTSVEVSELLSRMLTLRKIPHQVLNAKLHQKEADIVAEAGKAGTVTIATNMAGRGTDIKINDEVKQAGGLAIIGSEKHDSRRVDRQLRGRSGRQGDPGSSQFYLSLEDDLMRLFGSERVASIMDRLGLKEGEVIQHSMITRSIERAQKKVEENNFGIRKHLLEYDDVMNAQREVIYKRRRHALFGERLSLDIDNMFYESAAIVSKDFVEAKDFEGFRLEMIKQFAIETPVTEQEFLSLGVQQVTQKVFHAATEAYRKKALLTSEMAFPVIANVFENEGAKFENILIPFSNGIKTIQIAANLKRAYDSKGREILVALEKSVVLSFIDNEWKEHLRELDDLRTSVRNAVYEQKDPLLIYKFESYNLFKSMITRMNFEIVSFLTHAGLPLTDQAQAANDAPKRQEPKTIESKPGEVQGGYSSPRPPAYIDPSAQQAPLSRRERRKAGK
ncbi:MAG TPA: preprotein translocase subunit SecA [Luteibaculaceae bacterium]|nr:preprotein translocase subunit SecA [Luteibaculaceae bacterium]